MVETSSSQVVAAGQCRRIVTSRRLALPVLVEKAGGDDFAGPFSFSPRY
jgi:hypothetical protein